MTHPRNGDELTGHLKPGSPGQSSWPMWQSQEAPLTRKLFLVYMLVTYCIASTLIQVLLEVCYSIITPTGYNAIAPIL